jgi:diketogulonate reductase-like aldo/keto reductase
MQQVTLNNGVEMPILGFGVFQIPDAAECERAVSDAIETGYRLIDTAAAYGNEEAVGNAIRKSGIPREEFFVTSKVWVEHTGYERTNSDFQRSLDYLQTAYLDLYLIHQPYGDIFGSWRAMQELLEAGKIRAIGVANFHPDRMVDLVVNSGYPPAVNRIETHPFYQQIDAHGLLKDYQVQHQSWGPFAEGKKNIFTNDMLAKIGSKYGKSVAQVILRWLIQRGIVAIPKTVHKARMIENFSVFDFELSKEDMQAILDLDTSESLFFDHRNPKMVKSLSEVELNR